MRKRGSGETPSVIRLIRGVYKSLAIRSSELMARLSGVRKESRKVVVFEKGIVKEATT